MTTFGLGDIYASAEQGAPIGLPDGNYDLEVTDARPRAESRLIFIDYVVLNGPSAGKAMSTNLYIPDSSNSGAGFHFRKKIKGFLSPEVKAAFTLADSAASFEDALEIIADALPGIKLNANIGLVKEGKYKGSNELQDTSPLETASARVIADTDGASIGEVATPPVQQADVQVAPSNGQNVAPVEVPF